MTQSVIWRREIHDHWFYSENTGRKFDHLWFLAACGSQDTRRDTNSCQHGHFWTSNVKRNTFSWLLLLVSAKRCCVVKWTTVTLRYFCVFVAVSANVSRGSLARVVDSGKTSMLCQLLDILYIYSVFIYIYISVAIQKLAYLLTV